MCTSGLPLVYNSSTMAYCSNCSKLTGIEEADLEDDLQVDELGNVSGTITIENNCSECGNAVKRAEFDVDRHVELDHDDGDDAADQEHDLEVTAHLERFQEERPPRAKRRRKFYGVQGDVDVECSCGAKGSFTVHEEIQSSHMDEA